MMNGLKNLMPKGIFAQTNYTTLKRKSQDFKKSINTFVEHLQQINSIYENYYNIFEKNIADLVEFFPYDDDSNSKFFRDVIIIFKKLNKQLRNFIQKQSNNQQSILQLSDLFMADYNVLVEQFQQKCRQYSQKQQNLVQSGEEYFKMYRQMLNNIQSYKSSFMDVNIIYNKVQKIKRYNQCICTYKNLEQDLVIITKKVEQLNKDKIVLSEKYLILQRQLTNFTSSFAMRYIDELKKFAECLFQQQNNKGFIIQDQLQEIDNAITQKFFVSSMNLRYSQCINGQVKLSQSQCIPCFVFYSGLLRQNARPMFKKMVVIYFQQISIKIQKRKIMDRKIIEYMQKYLKTLDKNLMSSYRQTMFNFDKMRKKIGQVFGNRWLSFYKIVTSIFENSIENTGRLMKRVEGKIKMIEANISEQVSIYDAFLKDFRNFIDRYISKKVFKKYTQQYEQKSQTLLQQEISTSQEQISNISKILSRQISKVDESIFKCDSTLKNLYIAFLGDIKTSISEFQGFSDDISSNYYQEEIYQRNYQLCSDQIILSVKKQMNFFEQLPFFALNDNQKITFDGEFNKIQGFKKIKKPKELEEMLKENNKLEIFMQNKGEADNISVSNSNAQTVKTLSQNQKLCFIGNSVSKHAEFLSKKIEYHPNQKFVKSSSCALVDKIILAGRLFITTHRLFFHSKFNRSTVFFGQTFIEIPKLDIKKVEKKSSSVLINNAISITTINGELFFISFLSRDKFFDLIITTFEINHEQMFFEQEQVQEEIKEVQLEFEDDMKMETSAQRQINLTKQLKEFEYKSIYTSEFELVGLTPIKFLKLFELDQQMTINRTVFTSFSYYLKDLAEHKEINIENWSPNPLDYLNNINIKEITPELFTRRIGAVIPLPNSGIPFMPKSSFTTEDQSLFIINKDKYVIELIVKSNGVPYCDAFDLRMKKTVERADQNKVKMTVEIFVNFNQNVMVKSTIQSKSLQSSIEAFQKNGNEIKLYLKVLQKKMLKGNKRQNPEDKFIEQAETIEQLSKEIQQLKGERKVNLSTIQSQKGKIKSYQIGIMVLLAAVIVQLCLLIL